MTEMTITDDEAYQALRDHIEETVHQVAAVSQEFKLRVYHSIGKSVATSSLYRKNKEGNGELIKRLAEDVKLRPAMLYDSILIYEKFPAVSTLVEKFPNVTEARRALRGADCDHQHPAEKEEVVKTVVRCSNCKRKI